MRRLLSRLSVAKLLVAVVLGSFVGTLIGVGYVSTQSNASLKAVAAAPGLQNAASVGITGGTITGTNVPYDVAKWGIPFIVAPTGTMANNGAVTLGTALGTTYSGGAWLYLPAGAVAAGVPAAAAWLWCVMSSTTVGTVYNSTYTTGTPTLGTTTAFATTGPGAFAGVTSQITGPQITIAANALGTSGRLTAKAEFTNTGSGAGTHLIGFVLGGTDFSGNTFASTATANYVMDLFNSGATNVNYGTGVVTGAAGGAHSAAHWTAIDFTAQQTFAFKFTRGTATENYVMEAGYVEVTN